MNNANGLDWIGSSEKNTELGTFGVGTPSTLSSVVKPMVPSKQIITDKVIKPVPILPFLCK
jgi:hypothetical protein